MTDWVAIAEKLGIELDEDGKFQTTEDWLRAGQEAFKDDDGIHIMTLSRDAPEETFDTLHELLD